MFEDKDEDEDDENVEKYAKSIEIICELEQLVGVQKADIESEKKRIHDEITEFYEEKLKTIEAETKKKIEEQLRIEQKKNEEALIEAHQREIERITAEAEGNLKTWLDEAPPVKRKQAIAARELSPPDSHSSSSSILDSSEDEMVAVLQVKEEIVESANDENGSLNLPE